MAKITCALSLSCASLFAQDGEPAQVEAGFLDRVVTVGGMERRYVVYVPPGYDCAREWPLIVFLNGRGECGTDGRRQTGVGLGEAIRSAPERWPFVVVFPQKPDKRSQWGDHEDLVLATLAETERAYRIDEQRRFLTGLSQGGSGAWQLGSRFADTWRAVAPVCGYRLGEWHVAALKDTPVWAFHGLADRTVPPEQSQLLTGELREAGGDPRLTLYEGVGHNSWDRAYRESALAEWFQLATVAPLLARLLADPASVTSAKLELSVPGADRPQTATVELDEGAISFEGEGTGAAVRWLQDPARTAELAGPMIQRTLQDLVRAGLFAGTAADGVRLSYVVRSDAGAAGGRFAVAADDPAAARVRVVFDALVARARAHAGDR